MGIVDQREEAKAKIEALRLKEEFDRNYEWQITPRKKEPPAPETPFNPSAYIEKAIRANEREYEQKRLLKLLKLVRNCMKMFKDETEEKVVELEEFDFDEVNSESDASQHRPEEI